MCLEPSCTLSFNPRNSSQRWLKFRASYVICSAQYKIKIRSLGFKKQEVEEPLKVLKRFYSFFLSSMVLTLSLSQLVTMSFFNAFLSK